MPAEQIEPAFKGLNTEAAPDFVGKNQAPVLANFLVNQPGKLKMRGPLTVSRAVGGGTETEAGPLWTLGEQALIQDAALNHYTVNLGTGTIAAPVTLPASIVDMGEVYTEVAGVTYGAPHSGGYLVKWDGLTLGFIVGPSGAKDVANFAERLFALGGTEPGAFTIHNDQLYFTDVGGIRSIAKTVTGVAATDIFTSTAHGYDNGTPVHFPALNGGIGLTLGQLYYVIAAAADTFQVSTSVGGAAVNFTTDVVATSTVIESDWTDSVSGLVNKIVLPADGVALARVGSALALFHRNSVSLLQGSGAATWSVRPALHNRGLVHRRGVLELGDSVLFLSDDGLYQFDGSSATLISEDVSTPLVEALTTATGTIQAGLSYLTGGYAHLVVKSSSAGVDTILFSKAVHVATRSWTTLDADAAIMPRGMLWPANTDSHSLIWDGNRLWLADDITTPVGATGWDSYDAVRAPIPAVWHSRLTALSSPHAVSAVRRLLVDYSFTTDGSDTTSPIVQLVNGEGDRLLTPTALPTVADPPTYLHRARFKQDVYGEGTDVQVQVHWNPTDGTADLVEAELYSATLEYTAAQQR